MFDLASCCRTVAGLLAMVLVGFMLYGCSAESPAQFAADPVALTTTLADPAPVTEASLDTAAVKPANPADAVAMLETPIIEASTGSAVMPAGEAPTLDVDLGNTGAATGSLPLTTTGTGVMGNRQAALPAGDHAMRLGAGTTLDLDDATELASRGSFMRRLRITGFAVRFSVHKNRPPSWTLPNSYKLNLERRKRAYVLAGSMLTLRWYGRMATPPRDGLVTLTVNLYKDNMKVAGPLTKTMPVVNNTATFTSDTHVEFNRADVLLDVRDSK
jgi:hypothetical protein